MTTTKTIPETRTATAAPANLGQMLLDSASRHHGIALEYQGEGRTVSISYDELATRAREIARGLIAIGVDSGDRVAIFATTCAEWTIADYGVLCAGAVVAPVYHTSSPDECAYVLGHSQARVVFCGDTGQAAKVQQVRDRCPSVERVIRFDEADGDAISMLALTELGASVPETAVDERLAACGREDLATLVYTSGTTGPAKGCMLSHGNMLETARMYVDELGIGEHHALYQFLPLAHVMARVAQAVVLSAGAKITFWSGDATKIIDELAERKPTHFPAVPRVYEKIHGAVMGRVQDSSALQQRLFRWALEQGARSRRRQRSGEKLGTLETVQFRLADRLVLSRVRNVFGEGLEMALVGAAAVAPELLEFFDACGVLVLEGYGLSESCSVATLNTPRALRFGTVGRPLPGTQVTVAADGELLLRGPHIFKGYYRNAEATDEAITGDGWLRTGDLGAISDDGFVSITGRKKDLIITSNGKNITPVNIESELRETRYITEAVVFGDDRPYLVAMLTIDRDEAAKLAARLGIAPDPSVLAHDPGVRAAIQREVDAVNEKLARIEQIKRFAILERELSQAEGELTPTMKVKRAFVYKKYAKQFAELYDKEPTT